jgi:hypothetical protein
VVKHHLGILEVERHHREIMEEERHLLETTLVEVEKSEIYLFRFVFNF